MHDFIDRYESDIKTMINRIILLGLGLHSGLSIT
jgi:hypothetical protein